MTDSRPHAYKNQHIEHQQTCCDGRGDSDMNPGIKVDFAMPLGLPGPFPKKTYKRFRFANSKIRDQIVHVKCFYHNTSHSPDRRYCAPWSAHDWPIYIIHV